MALSKAVSQCLDLQNVDYNIIIDEHSHEIGNNEEHPFLVHSPDPENIVHMVILQDSIGKLQIMLPGNCLIDLTALCETIGRNLQAISRDDEDALLAKLGLSFLPSVPQLTGLNTIADSSLFTKEELFLNSGVNGHYIKLNQTQFKRAMKEVDSGDFAKKIPNFSDENLVISGEEDEAKIVEAVEKFTTLRIKQRLEKTLEIPPMPDTAEKIIRVRVDPDAGVGDLAQIVETDPSLAAQVVSWAGSPFYGAPGNIKSVHDAVVRVLGFDLVINLALGLALGKTLNLPKDGPRGITPYWLDSVYTALAMEALVSQIPVEQRPTLGLAYLSGLLHNFGYLILSYVFPPHFSVISRFMEVNRHVGHHHIEKYVIGVSREQISSWLLKSWNMPDQVVTGIRWQQHQHYNQEDSIYANLLYLVSQLLKEHRIGEQLPQPIPAEAFERVGIEPEDAREAIRSVIEKSSDIKNMADFLGKG